MFWTIQFIQFYKHTEGGWKQHIFYEQSHLYSVTYVTEGHGNETSFLNNLIYIVLPTQRKEHGSEPHFLNTHIYLVLPT